MKKIYLLLLALTFAACEKNDVSIASLNDATYAGKFFYSNNDPTVSYVPLSGNVTLVMNNQAYSCTSPSTSFGAAARGSFSVAGSQFTFRDSTVHTANFDGNMVLTGTYASTVKGDSLFLVKTLGYNKYTYKLKKQ